MVYVKFMPLSTQIVLTLFRLNSMHYFFKVIHLMSARFTCKLFRFLVCAEGNKLPIFGILPYCMFPLV